MPTRGVLYIVWGDGIDAILNRSLESLKRIHPELPVEIKRMPPGSNLLDKAGMMAMTPFDETLFLDADTVVLDRLDFGFDRAAKVGLACCICECPWARRYNGLDTGRDAIEYNTGVLFFTRIAKPLFEAWRACAKTVDSSIYFVRGTELTHSPFNDQGGFARAMIDTAFNPFVLPLNWNFRPQWHRSWFGPLKIWHDPMPVPKMVLDWNADQILPNAVMQYAELKR